jgi:hypothetical protein
MHVCVGGIPECNDGKKIGTKGLCLLGLRVTSAMIATSARIKFSGSTEAVGYDACNSEYTRVVMSLNDKTIFSR